MFNLKELKFNESYLTVIKQKTFKDLKNLKILHINTKGDFSLSFEIFNSLSNLEELSINKLESTFASFRNLVNRRNLSIHKLRL